MPAAPKFQVKLSGDWKDYAADEDKILKRAFLAGFPNCKYSLRGQKYEVNFQKMSQKNVSSGKERDIRPPYKWKPPEAPVVAKGPTMCVKVPPGTPGQTIQVPHPKAKDKFIAVKVPPTAKVGQAMLVPVPDAEVETPCAEETIAAPPPTASEAEKKAGWSTGAKVAAGTAAVIGVGGLAVGGAVLGEHIAEEGWDATMADLGDAATAAGDGIVDGAEAAGDWIGDAADTAGDFIMDLF